jgi:NADPH2:quinone reductase
MVGVLGRDQERLDPLALWENCTDVQGVYYPALLPQEHSRCFRVVAGLIDDVAKGKLNVLIDRVFPLTEAAQAHRFIAERKAFGRVLLKPLDPGHADGTGLGGHWIAAGEQENQHGG